jgi:hypothetical protein
VTILARPQLAKCEVRRKGVIFRRLAEKMTAIADELGIDHYAVGIADVFAVLESENV